MPSSIADSLNITHNSEVRSQRLICLYKQILSNQVLMQHLIENVEVTDSKELAWQIHFIASELYRLSTEC